jgi:hypothetical protein
LEPKSILDLVSSDGFCLFELWGEVGIELIDDFKDLKRRGLRTIAEEGRDA